MLHISDEVKYWQSEKNTTKAFGYEFKREGFHQKETGFVMFVGQPSINYVSGDKALSIDIEAGVQLIKRLSPAQTKKVVDHWNEACPTK